MVLWEDITSRGFAAISDLVSNRAPESQQLEFKRKGRPKSPGITDDDRKNFGKSLSAFSNATGGVLIWGIGTASSGDETHADKLDPISQPERFAQELENLIPQYLSPPNLDIEVTVIKPTADNGFVAVKIGASDARPHMSRAKKQNTYYLRVGNSTMPMEHFQVEDMLRIRSVPKLAIGYFFLERGRTGAEYVVEATLTCKNLGSVSAHHAYIITAVSRYANYQAVERVSQLVPQVEQPRRYFTCLHSIHPELELSLAYFNLTFRMHNGHLQLRGRREETYEPVSAMASIDVEARVGCEDVPAREVGFELPSEYLEQIGRQIIAGVGRIRGERYF